jgi:hypothetical protein
MLRYTTLTLVLVAMFGASVSAGASPSRDGASIVDSGSTNTPGYRIEIRSDATAAITPQNRAGVAQGATKPFSVEGGVASRFFADLAKARAANVAGSPCMKSASFGTTTRVTWHGWTSPDLDCPAENQLVSALIHDVNLIRAAAGIGGMPGVHRGGAGGGPIQAEPPSPSPGQSPPKL